MTDQTYCYPPDFDVLRNRFDVRTRTELDRVESEFVSQRLAEELPIGSFDLAHLRAIHRHLFQDVYEWAGELRLVEIAKGGSAFQPRRFIETGFADIHRRLVALRLLRGATPEAFAREAGVILGDVNYVHPFREGNGRSQLVYVRQLAEQAGHRLDLSRIDRDGWIDASRRAHESDYAPIIAAIHGLIV